MNIRKSLCKAFDCARYCPKTCEEEIARLKEEYEGQISKLKGQVNDYRMQIDDLQKKIDECKSLVSNLEAQVEDWKKKYEEEKARPKRPDYCRPDECPFKPNDPDDDPPKLRVEGNRIFYGNDPIKLCSVSRWEALWREKGLYYDWRPYSLAWYEEELAKYGINYVRHGAVKDFDFVYQHCKRMKEKGIIVELTIFRSLGEGRLIDLIPENIQALVGLGNVFFDCHNEFMDSREDVFEAKRIAEIISENGGIVSGGAWGASTYGEENAALFQQVCPYHKISTVHRQWNKAEIEKSLQYGKPVIRNEYFDRGELGLEMTKQIMRETFEAGAQGCQYYGFAMPGLQGLIAPDPFGYEEILAFAGDLARELNSGVYR